VASGATPVGEGRRGLRIEGAFALGPYVLELTATEGARQAASRQSVFLGGSLPMRWARRIARAPRAVCHRFAARRIDCRRRSSEPSALSIRLARSGQVFSRPYTTSSGEFAERPHYVWPAARVDVVRLAVPRY
jgi:hypothetical protein